MPESLLRTFSCDDRKPLQAGDASGGRDTPTPTPTSTDRHKYYCRRLVRALLLVANHPDYSLLPLLPSSPTSKCYCHCRSSAGSTTPNTTAGSMCWCFCDVWLTPTSEYNEKQGICVGDDSDWSHILNDINIQQGGRPQHSSSSPSTGRVSSVELTEAVGRAADLYSKRYLLPSDDPDAPNTTSNPIPNVMSLPCDPAGAFVVGPTRGHACDFANVLLEEWLDYDGWVKHHHHKHSSLSKEDGSENCTSSNKHEWMLDCLYNKLQLTTMGQAEGYVDDAKTTTSLLPDLVLIGSFVDGGQQSCEMLVLLSWLSLSLLTPPQYNPPSSSASSLSNPAVDEKPLPTSILDRDRIAVIRGQHELLFPISSHITSHFVGRLDEELRLRFAITSSTPRTPLSSTTTTTCVGVALTQPRQQSPHSEPLELKELPHHHVDYEVLQKTLHPLLELCALDGHLKLRSGSSSLHLEAERLVYALMDHLPIAAVLQGRYFCVAGGIPSSMRTIEELQTNILDTGRAIGGDDDGDAFDKLCEVMFSDPMGDDDERRLGHLAMFASNFERGLSHVYSFNAVCRFLRENDLTCVIRGNPYTSHRFSQATNQMGRPWSYQYSPNDPGYQCYRTNPDTGFPSIVSLFSAPQFCSQNNNYGAFARVPPPQASSTKSRRSFSKKGKKESASRFIQIHQFQAHPRRPLQVPGTSVSAFSWSLGMMSEFLYSAVTNMLAGDQIDNNDADREKKKLLPPDQTINALDGCAAVAPVAADEDGTSAAPADQNPVEMEPLDEDAANRAWAETEVKNRVAKFHRLCQLLYKEDLPLPSLELLRGEIEAGEEEKGIPAIASRP